jgi:hypothetical protein
MGRLINSDGLVSNPYWLYEDPDPENKLKNQTKKNQSHTGNKCIMQIKSQ